MRAGGSALGDVKVDGQQVKPQKARPKALTKRGGSNPTNLLNPTSNNLVNGGN
jgi:hypothetical protein